ncbi:hypothetical protein [Phenylobacterium sp.]|uniref:hypothetical protein n=1 Tax=Phenylobacterium sp. TaxID=1871053 RepID=UPI002812779D|nr:hypothetical protein [Phenylobacterium sp.]
MIGTLTFAAVVAMSPAPVRGDFDGDGKIDTAEVTQSGRGQYELIVHLARDERAPVTVATFNELASLHVTTQRPGRHKTWCGKGGGPKDAPCPRREVTLSGDTLAFGTKEASLMVAIWNGESFDVIGLSD